ncbi:IS3 family transposase, partial [Salmonella enterica]|uniref:IS3 family transposase n=1 Tax=Salmonella enterica TaxID=28901 RepID=UPI0034DEB8F7
MPESTYHYHLSKKDEDNKDEKLEELIQEIFEEHKGNYGYRRIRDELHARGHQVNHKRVKRIMDKLGLKCTKFSSKTRKYNSYKGKVGKIAQNRLNRRFMTPIPLQKLGTDVTEFTCTNDEKLYLSHIID